MMDSFQVHHPACVLKVVCLDFLFNNFSKVYEHNGGNYNNQKSCMRLLRLFKNSLDYSCYEGIVISNGNLLDLYLAQSGI